MERTSSPRPKPAGQTPRTTPETIRIFLAFVIKDAKIAAGYRIASALALASLATTLFSFWYFSRLVPPTDPLLAPYAGGYFAWAVVGVTVTDFLSAWLNGVTFNLRESMITSMLDALIGAPLSPSLIVVATMLWPMISAAGQNALFFCLAFGLTRTSFVHANWLSAGVIAVLAWAAFTGLALMASSFVLVFKRGDPITKFFWTFGSLMTGAIIPLDLLPQWLRFLANCLPPTVAIEGLRLAVLRGARLDELGKQLFALALMSLAFIGVGFGCLSASVHYLRRGSGFSKY